VVTKTSIMLGFGEEPKEIRQTMRDMRDAGVEIFTLGQYLRPSKRHMKVTRMLPPEEYDGWREEGMAMGFKFVASGPLVRSRYKAGEVFMEAFLDRRDAERGELDDGGAPLPLDVRPSQILSAAWVPADAEAQQAAQLDLLSRLSPTSSQL
jgi:lipoic acid synthetase